MLKHLLIPAFVICSFGLTAQAPLTSKNLKFEQTAQPWAKQIHTGAEAFQSHVANPNLPLIDRTDKELTVGTSAFDLQSNSGIGRRLDIGPDGKIYAVWTRGTKAGAPGYLERGTGLNIYDPASGWGPDPTDRIEPERCGWPSVGVLSSGNPVIVSHTTVQNKMFFSRWDGTQWVQNTIPTNVPAGVIWPRLAIGGDDGMTVHVIGLTYPVGNGGAVYEGLDGHLLYYRSTDGGVTWDIKDMKLPEMDTSFYKSMSADNYYIDANGSTIAVGYFANWGDSKVAKSTWTTTTIWDFPLDQYSIMDGYTEADIPVDPDAPTTIAILTTDETGTVLVDNNGNVHAWFGEMYVQDDVFTDASFSYYPAHMGLRYWNEGMGENNSELLIPGILDENGNDTLDIASASDIALYYCSLTSHPSAGIDENGIIYLAYSSLSESNISTQANPNQQHTRHIIVTATTDGGDTWTDPWDIINEDLIIEPDFITLYETMFPAVARTVNDQMHVLYMQDFEPGLSAANYDVDPVEDNNINYLALDVEQVLNGGVSSAQNVNPSVFAFEISPNPASDMIKIAYELPKAAQTSIYVYDMMGRQVKALSSAAQGAGNHTALLSVGNLSKGMYFVRLQSGDQFGTQKILVN
jgi:hypothetical protein